LSEILSSLIYPKLNLTMGKKRNPSRFRKIPKRRPQLIPLDPSLSKTTCRVCLENKRTATTPMEIENIFLFKECTGFDVLLNGASHMPTHICNKCKGDLLSCNLFLNQCNRTENILKQIYQCEDRPKAMQLFSSHKKKNEFKRTNKKLSEELKDKKV
jgi:hypothetical protein